MTSASTSPIDIISDLPNNVVENILMGLPTREAVKTSLLSRKWRYKWAKLPELKFIINITNKSPFAQQRWKYKVLLAIFQALLLHCAPILKFTLSISGLESCLELDQIALFLSRNGIEDLTLDIRSSVVHNLPCHLFSCERMRHLNLRSFVFKPPRTFQGFTKLTSRELREFTFAADVIGRFISSCPLLERLTLERFTTSHCLEIGAPNLKCLRIRGIFKSISFNNTALLSAVSVDAHVFLDEESLKLLAAGSVPKRLPTILNHLKYLKITNLYLMEIDEVSFSLCMITSSPNLIQIIIQLHSKTTDPDMGSVLDFLKVQGCSDISFNQLREVQMLEVSGMLPEFEFIKLMLAKSPKLERMLIKPISGADVNKGFNILKEMTRFQRASPKAEIIYLDTEEKLVSE